MADRLCTWKPHDEYPEGTCPACRAAVARATPDPRDAELARLRARLAEVEGAARRVLASVGPGVLQCPCQHLSAERATYTCFYGARYCRSMRALAALVGEGT